MLTPSLPRSLADLLIVFRPCFTAPTFATFRAMVAGFLAQPGLRTVTGMLAGAGWAGRRHHDLAYRFFATARWSVDQLGLVLLDLITQTLVPAGAPLVLARELVDLVCGHLGDRQVQLVGDAAYIGKPLQGLPAQVTVTARLRANAALYTPAPPPTGRRGRPRVKGDRLPELIMLAAMTRYRWTPVTLHCYGKTLDREVLAIGCLWYGALKGQPVQVVL